MVAILPAQSPALVDHRHRVTADWLEDDAVTTAKLADSVYGGTPTAIDPDDAGAAGSAATVSRSDHGHQFTTSAPSSLTKTTTNSEGSGGTMVRNDHTHATDALPWGVPPNGVFSSTGNDSARAAGVDTDMTVTVALTAGRLYKITLNVQIALGAASVAVAVDLEHDGTLVGRFARIGSGTNAAGNGPFTISAVIDYVPSATDASATLTVINSAGSGTAITCQPNAGIRTLTVVDAGPT